MPIKGKSKESNPTPVTVQMPAELTETLGMLKTGMSGLVQAIAGLSDGQKSMSDNFITALNNLGKEPAEDRPAPTEDELEKMDRSEFAQVIAAQVAKPLQDEIIELKQNLKNITEQNTSAVSSLAVGHHELANPEFKVWKDEVLKIMAQYEGMSVNDAIVLAKEKNPEKVKELADKDKSDEPTESNLSVLFGGLEPADSSEESASDDKKDFNKAANDAWDKVMGAVSQ